MATPQQIAVTQLYTALFNRAPDAAGLAFWEQAMLNGASINTIAQSFFTSPEALAIYPSAAPTTQFVTRFYTTVFGREPDAEGLVFWSNALDAQGGAGNAAARAALVTQLVDIVSTPLTSKPAGISDAAYAQTVADRGRFINKTDVGVYFATELKSDDRALAAKVLATVTHEPASVTEARGVAVGTPPTPTVPTTPGGGSGGVTPPAAPLITHLDSVEQITARLSGAVSATAKVDASQMDVAQLLAVTGSITKVAMKGITNLWIGPTEAVVLKSAGIIALLYRAEGAKFTVTPTVWQSMSSAVIYADRIADGGVDGEITLTDSIDGRDFYFGPKIASTAKIRVDNPALSMLSMQALVDNIAKVSVIDNLLLRFGSPGWVTDDMAAVLLTKASNPTFDIGDATDAQLHMIAARIIAQEPTSVRGLIDLSNGGFTFEESMALVSKNLIAGARVSGAGWTQTQLAEAVLYAEKITFIYGASLKLGDSALTDSMSLTLLQKISGSEVDVTQASEVELAAVIERVVGFGNFTIIGEMAVTSAVRAVDMSPLFWRYQGTSATADLTSMTTEQQSNVFGAIAKFAADGITGTATLGSTVNISQLRDVLAKTSVGADITIDAASMIDQQLVPIALNISKVDLIKNLSFADLYWTTDETMTAVFSKVVDAKVNASNASSAQAALLVSNLAKIADAGITGTLTLSPNQFLGVKSSLDVKLGASAGVVITGTTGNDEVDLRALSHGTKLNLGAGADVIQAGGGADIVSIASTAHSRGQGFDLTDTSTANIDQVLGLAAGDVLNFSTNYFVYGSTLRFAPNATATIKRATFQAEENQSVSIQDVLDFLSGKTGDAAFAPSTSSVANFYEVTIEGGKGLSGKLLVLNDQNSVLNINDLIIGISGTITEQSFSFTPM